MNITDFDSPLIAREFALRLLSEADKAIAGDTGVAMEAGKKILSELFKLSAKRERFAGVFLRRKDGRLVLANTWLGSEGTRGSCALYPRELLTAALKMNADHILLAHNHPGGTTSPSPADRLLKDRIGIVLSAVQISANFYIFSRKTLYEY